MMDIFCFCFRNVHFAYVIVHPKYAINEVAKYITHKLVITKRYSSIRPHRMGFDEEETINLINLVQFNISSMKVIFTSLKYNNPITILV